MAGKFIVFEGGEGSGKTRHSRFVAEQLQAEGHDVLHTLEPGGSDIGSKIREVILMDSEAKLDPRAELLLFLADRAHHVATVIQPALDAGKVVICDRFSGSTYAYQLGGRELPNAEFVKQMDAYARYDLQPDLVMYLDIAPEAGVSRKQDAGQQLNRLDNEVVAFHERVRSYFMDLAQNEQHWQMLSTEGPKEENAQKILEAVKAIL